MVCLERCIRLDLGSQKDPLANRAEKQWNFQVDDQGEQARWLAAKVVLVAQCARILVRSPQNHLREQLLPPTEPNWILFQRGYFLTSWKVDVGWVWPAVWLGMPTTTKRILLRTRQKSTRRWLNSRTCRKSNLSSSSLSNSSKILAKRVCPR